MKAFLQYTLWSTLVSSAIFGFTLYKNEPQRRLVFAIVKYAKSKLEGHPDPTEVLKVLSDIQGVQYERPGEGTEAPVEVTDVPDAPSEKQTSGSMKKLMAAARKMVGGNVVSTNDGSAEGKAAEASQSTLLKSPNVISEKDHYVQIDGKYYQETRDHVYVINGQRVFFEDQLHRTPGSQLRAQAVDQEAQAQPPRQTVVTVSRTPTTTVAPAAAPAPSPTPSNSAQQPDMQEMLKTLDKAKANQEAERTYLNELMTDK